MAKVKKLEPQESDAQRLRTPTDLSSNAVPEIGAAVNGLVAEAFALYLKTKNVHWHVSGPHFRDYHLLLDEQASQIFGDPDALAERVRKIGGKTLKSIGHVAKLQSVKDNDEDYVDPLDMLRELIDDNKNYTVKLREAHEIASKHSDVGTTSLLETIIDETEKRTWFLFETAREADETGH
jgi:starvation-inducible DNA-binding protein